MNRENTTASTFEMHYSMRLAQENMRLIHRYVTTPTVLHKHENNANLGLVSTHSRLAD